LGGFFILIYIMAILTTQLEAVNSMLAHIGEAPVSTISDAVALPVSASTALSTLNEVSKEVQSEDWHFNSIPKLTLSPAGDKRIGVPQDAITLDAIDKNIDVTMRGNYLFDRKNNTNLFDGDVVVKVSVFLPWEELYEQARRYIVLRASRIFQARLVGSKELEALIARDEYQARARLEDADSSHSDRTMFDNYDVAIRIGVNRNYQLS
jgi:hypothetical protein